MKGRGFAQGLFKCSATQMERLGTLRFDDFGRVFRYAKAGASALHSGMVGIMVAAASNHIKQVQTAYANAVGLTQVVVLIGATAVAIDDYKDGFLQVYDGAAGNVGEQYPIVGNSYSAGTGALTLFLAEPLRVAIAATDTISLIPNPFLGVTESSTIANAAAGIPVIPVTALYYYWAQVGGPGIALNVGGTSLGSVLTVGTTNAGATQTMAGYTSGVIGYVYSFAAITTKYSPVWLQIG